MRFLFTSLIISLVAFGIYYGVSVYEKAEVQEQIPAEIPKIELAVHNLVNVQRIVNGRHELRWSLELYRLAQEHSQFMARELSLCHSGLPYGENVYCISHISFGLSSEEIATEMVDCWMNSTGHRENILDRRYDKTGIGIALADNGGLYATQIFD